MISRSHCVSKLKWKEYIIWEQSTFRVILIVSLSKFTLFKAILPAVQKCIIKTQIATKQNKTVVFSHVGKHRIQKMFIALETMPSHFSINYFLMAGRGQNVQVCFLSVSVSMHHLTWQRYVSNTPV